MAKKRAHEDSNARPPKKRVKVLPLGNYSSRQQKNLTWHRRLRVYHQPPTTNHRHHHRLKNGSLFDRLSRSRSKFPRERSTPTPMYLAEILVLPEFWFLYLYNCKKEWVAMIHANYDSKQAPRGSNIRPMIHVSSDTRYL